MTYFIILVFQIYSYQLQKKKIFIYYSIYYIVDVTLITFIVILIIRFL